MGAREQPLRHGVAGAREQQLCRGLVGAREQPLRHGLAGAREQPVRTASWARARAAVPPWPRRRARAAAPPRRGHVCATAAGKPPPAGNSGGRGSLTRTASRPEEGDQGRRNSQGQKGHFPCFSLLESPEMNILFGPVSTSKFVRNQSVHQQIVKFCMPASKEGSLGMSGSKISPLFITTF